MLVLNTKEKMKRVKRFPHHCGPTINVTLIVLPFICAHLGKKCPETPHVAFFYHDKHVHFLLILSSTYVKMNRTRNSNPRFEKLIKAAQAPAGNTIHELKWNVTIFTLCIFHYIYLWNKRQSLCLPFITRSEKHFLSLVLPSQKL